MIRRAWGALWPQWVDRNLRIILLARTSMSVARSIAGVVVVLYLAAEGMSSLEIGGLFLVVTVVSALLSTSVGLLSDRFGRKPFLVVVPLLAALSAAVYCVVRAPVALFVFGALGSFGRGAGAGGGSVGPYQPAESAFVAEGVPSSARSAAFGRLAFTSTFGALIGGLLAGLAETHAHMSPAAATAAYRPAFVAAGILAAVAGMMAMWLREPQRSSTVPTRSGNRTRLVWPRRSWPALWRLSTTNAVNGMAMGMVGPFVSYWLARRYGVSPGTIGLLFAVINAGSLVSTLAAAEIGRRIGTVRAIVAARALGGLLLVPMVLAPAFWIAGAVYFVRMFTQRIGLPLRQSFTQDVAHPDERASVAALSNLPAQGTMGASQVLAGYLFEAAGLAAPFEVAAVFQCVNAVLYGAFFGWSKPTSSDGGAGRFSGGRDGGKPRPPAGEPRSGQGTPALGGAEAAHGPGRGAGADGPDGAAAAAGSDGGHVDSGSEGGAHRGGSGIG